MTELYRVMRSYEPSGVADTYRFFERIHSVAGSTAFGDALERALGDRLIRLTLSDRYDA